MGLSQRFKFSYNGREEVERFLENFTEDMKHTKNGKLLVVTEYKQKQMKFEMAIEDYGLYSHRSGEYFEVLGCLIEDLTAKFGRVEIDDL